MLGSSPAQTRVGDKGIGCCIGRCCPQRCQPRAARKAPAPPGQALQATSSLHSKQAGHAHASPWSD